MNLMGELTTNRLWENLPDTDHGNSESEYSRMILGSSAGQHSKTAGFDSAISEPAGRAKASEKTYRQSHASIQQLLRILPAIDYCFSSQSRATSLSSQRRGE